MEDFRLKLKLKLIWLWFVWGRVVVMVGKINDEFYLPACLYACCLFLLHVCLACGLLVRSEFLRAVLPSNFSDLCE